MVKKALKKSARSNAPAAAAKRKGATTGRGGKGVRPADGRESAAAVTIRMYCQGLGDCFLLAFPGTAGKPVHVLIDCGVILGTPAATEKMNQVVADIEAKTQGRIDLLVVTHEHWDHVSGFVQARKLLEKLKFDQVWLAWTENSTDPLANSLRQARNDKLRKLRLALSGIATGLKARASSESVEEVEEGAAQATVALQDVESARRVLDFFGPEPAARRPAAAGGAKGGAVREGSTEDAMNWVKQRATRFCTPGERYELPRTGVEVYVLGPPRDEKLLHKDAPSRGKDEAYEFQADRLGLSAALDRLAGGADSDLAGSVSAPFENRFVISQEEARLDPFFREHYGFDDNPLAEMGDAWRRIDLAFVEGATRLALKLDSDTNNTSLALAFELADGRTLIFPGDAQIGNWLSWKTVGFRDSAGRDLHVTAQDLLGRAVFYKVGHHGSHNATLKAGGLEAMNSGKLVAMIPVDEQMALAKRPPQTGWKMPFASLAAELERRTSRRVLRADRNEADFGQRMLELAAANPETQADLKAFRRQVEFSDTPLVRDPNERRADQPLYVEYRLPLA